MIPIKHSNTSGYAVKNALICEPIEREQMKPKINTLILAVTSLFLLGACGLKGPLYQTPNQQQTEQQSESSTQMSKKEKVESEKSGQGK